MSSTAAPVCSKCGGQFDDCDECGGRRAASLLGPAALRGTLWAEEVVRHLVARWPVFWPRSPRAQIIAVRKVADLAPRDDSLKVRLARACMEAAARRYSELTGFLARRRLLLPDASASEDADDEIPK